MTAEMFLTFAAGFAIGAIVGAVWIWRISAEAIEEAVAEYFSRDSAVQSSTNRTDAEK